MMAVTKGRTDRGDGGVDSDGAWQGNGGDGNEKLRGQRTDWVNFQRSTVKESESNDKRIISELEKVILTLQGYLVILSL